MSFESIVTFIQKPMPSIWLISLYACYVCLEVYLNIKQNYFQMTEERLTKQKLFKQSIRLPVISSLYFGVFSWIGHQPQFNSEGFIKFIEISKLPMGILSLSIPFVAIVSSIHRTIQTENQINKTQKQIDLVSEKNRSDAYYSHLKTYADIFKTLPSFTLSRSSKSNSINKEHTISVDHPYSLYKTIFYESTVSNGYSNKINITFLEKTQNLYRHFSHPIRTANQKMPVSTEITNLQNLEGLIISLCRELGINYDRQSHLFKINSQDPGLEIEVSFTDEEQIKQMLRGLRDILISLYTLIDQDPSVFQTNRMLGDLVPSYSYDSSYKIFPRILPITSNDIDGDTLAAET